MYPDLNIPYGDSFRKTLEDRQQAGPYEYECDSPSHWVTMSYQAEATLPRQRAQRLCFYTALGELDVHATDLALAVVHGIYPPGRPAERLEPLDTAPFPRLPFGAELVDVP